MISFFLFFFLFRRLIVLSMYFVFIVVIISTSTKIPYCTLVYQEKKRFACLHVVDGLHVLYLFDLQ